jgi:hypothetical protein
MEKSSQIAWKLVPLIHFSPLKVVPLIEVLLYSRSFLSGTSKSQLNSKLKAKSLLTIVICMEIGLKRQGKLSRLDQNPARKIPIRPNSNFTVRLQPDVADSTGWERERVCLHL